MTLWARGAITSQSGARNREAVRAGAGTRSPLRQVTDCAGPSRPTVPRALTWTPSPSQRQQPVATHATPSLAGG
jgi:hypothetical protein